MAIRQKPEKNNIRGDDSEQLTLWEVLLSLTNEDSCLVRVRGHSMFNTCNAFNEP